jgi:hypothetical protein
MKTDSNLLPASAATARSRRPHLANLNRTKTQPTIEMELRFPCHGQPESTSCDWLEEVREMRGSVLHAAGRRPAFLMPDGKARDSDPSDLHAFHIIARSRGVVAGCIRFRALEHARDSMIAGALGHDTFGAILRDLGMAGGRICEASRWMVMPGFRGQLGRSLAAGLWAASRGLSMDWAIALAGTRDRQDAALIRMGGCPVPSLPTIPSPDFDDELRMLYFNLARPSELMRKQMDEAASMMNL